MAKTPTSRALHRRGGVWFAKGGTHALVRVESTVEAGWSLLVTATIEDVVLLEEQRPLEHRRGRYRDAGS